MLNGGAMVIQYAARCHALALDRWVSEVQSQASAMEAFKVAARPPSPPAVVASLRFAYRVEESAARHRVEAVLSDWVEKADVAREHDRANLQALAGRWPRQERQLVDRIRRLGSSGKMVIVDRQDGEVVYWSNVDGWVDRASATLFTRPERAAMTLPDGNAPHWTDADR